MNVYDYKCTQLLIIIQQIHKHDKVIHSLHAFLTMLQSFRFAT